MWLGRNIDRLSAFGLSLPVTSGLTDVLPFYGALPLGLAGGFALFHGCEYLLKKTTGDRLSVRRYAKKTRRLDRIEAIVRGVYVERHVFTEDRPGRVVAVDDGQLLVHVSVPRGMTPRQIADQADALAAALQAYAVRVSGQEPGWVIFSVFPEDGLVSGLEMSAAVLDEQQANVTEPIVIGRDEVGQALPISLYAQAVLVGGSPGSGKSALSWSLLGHAALDPRTILIVLDLKPYGIETAPVHERADYVATTSADAAEILQRVWLETERRNKVLHSRLAEKADPDDDDMPPIMIVCDEAAELTRDGSDEGKTALQFLTRIVAVGRASGIGVILVTQKPDSSVIPTALRDLMGQRICLRVGTRAQAETILGPIPEGVQPWEIGTETPGRGYALDASGHVRLFQAAFIDRPQVIEMGQNAAQLRDRSSTVKFELPELPPAAGAEDGRADSQSGEGHETPKRRRRRR